MGERQYESVRRYFSDTELAEMHEGLVQRVGEVKDLRAEKTQANASMNAAIKGTEKGVFDLQEKLALGYETVEVEVLAIMDRPTVGIKTIIRVDTGEELRREAMTAREKQQSFGFGIAGEDDPRPER
jgi:hypothetical protein